MTSLKDLKDQSKVWTVKLTPLVSVEFAFPGAQRALAKVKVVSAGFQRYTRNPNGEWILVDNQLDATKVPQDARITVDLEHVYAKFLAGLILN